MIARLCLVFCLSLLAACGTVDAPAKPEDSVQGLALALSALSPSVDPAEAARAAEIAHSYTAQLAREYEITDPPLIHNAKVNAGIKPRGLCWHWAQDLRQRLAQEGFQTLSLHSAIANHNTILLEHSTTVLAATGAPWDSGLVLDPWRKGGTLTWIAVHKDRRYDWWHRDDVFAWKRQKRAAR